MNSNVKMGFTVGTFFLVTTFGVIEYIVPVVAGQVWRNDYQRLMFRCDHAMREHFIAKQLVFAKLSDHVARNLESTEIGLLACHKYDKLRKQLLSYGVSEARLSLMGLEALEEQSKDIRPFVEIHEIRY